MMSSFQYRLEADTSPGKRKLSSVDNAMLWARPTPDSNMPPHHTGSLCFCATSCTFFASEKPPTRPALMLMMRHAPASSAKSASRACRMDSSRQIDVRIAFCIHTKENVGPARAYFFKHIKIPSRLDLELDAPIAGGHFGRNLLYQLLKGVLDADRDSAGNLAPRSAEEFPQRQFLDPGLSVPNRVFQGCLGHTVPADSRK